MLSFVTTDRIPASQFSADDRRLSEIVQSQASLSRQKPVTSYGINWKQQN